VSCVIYTKAVVHLPLHYLCFLALQHYVALHPAIVLRAAYSIRHGRMSVHRNDSISVTLGLFPVQKKKKTWHRARSVVWEPIPFRCFESVRVNPN